MPNQISETSFGCSILGQAPGLQQVLVLLHTPLCSFVCPFYFSHSICPPIRLSFNLSFHLSVLPSVCLSVCLSVLPSVCLSVCLSVCPSISLSFHQSAHPSVCPSVLSSVCPSVYRPSLFLSLRTVSKMLVYVLKQQCLRQLITTGCFYSVRHQRHLADVHRCVAPEALHAGVNVIKLFHLTKPKISWSVCLASFSVY